MFMQFKEVLGLAFCFLFILKELATGSYVLMSPSFRHVNSKDDRITFERTRINSKPSGIMQYVIYVTKSTMKF